MAEGGSGQFDAPLIKDKISVRDVIKKESINFKDEFAIVSKDFAMAHIPFNNGVPRNSEYYGQTDRRIKEFMISKVLASLNPNFKPNIVIEMASAGSIAIATALPDSNVVSVDSDPQIFANGFRQIPVELTRETSISSNDEKINKTKEILDNWKPEIADAKNTGHPDSEFDLSVTLNNPNTFKDYVSEMARITKSGGYVIAIDHEVFKDKNDPSFYDTGKFNAPNYKPHGKIDEETANKLGLEVVPVPESIRGYENVVTWNSEGQEYSSGFVVQIYRKK